MTVLEQATTSGEEAQRRRGARDAGTLAEWVGGLDGADDPSLALLPFVEADRAALVVEELLSRAFDEGCQPRLRAELASLAAGLSAGERSSSLREQLGSDDEETRVTAAAALGTRGNSEAISALLEVAGDESPRVRAAALRALCDIGGREAGQAIAGLLDGAAGVDDGLLRALLQGVAGAGCDDAQACLLAHLEHACATVRLAALAALRSLPALERTDAVRALLSDADVRVRLHALSVLERHGGRDDGQAVAERLSDPDPRVRAMARDALHALDRARHI